MDNIDSAVVVYKRDSFLPNSEQNTFLWTLNNI